MTLGLFRIKPPAAVEITQAVKRLREEENGSETPNGKKRVSFGPYVSPEYFDKALPPSTPVRKVGFPFLGFYQENMKII